MLHYARTVFFFSPDLSAISYTLIFVTLILSLTSTLDQKAQEFSENNCCLGLHCARMQWQCLIQGLGPAFTE